MGEPQRVERENRNAPIKFDVEDVDTKINSSHLAGITSKSTEDAGDCDINDDSCIADQQRVMRESLKLLAGQSKQREDEKKPHEAKKEDLKSQETKKEEPKS